MPPALPHDPVVREDHEVVRVPRTGEAERQTRDARLAIRRVSREQRALVGAVAVTFARGGEYEATQCVSLGAARAVTVTTTGPRTRARPRRAGGRADGDRERRGAVVR